MPSDPAGLPLAGAFIRERLARLFGPSPIDPAGDPDAGLFGAESATWQVMAEPASIVGGIRGLLVQLLHPLAVAGVVQHSRYEQDPLARLHATARYVTATAFGSTEEALRAAGVVRAVHRHVAGRAPDGRTYSAADPHLLAWVSCALTSSFLAAHATFAPQPLSPAHEDAFVAEQSFAAALLDPRIDPSAIVASLDPLDGRTARPVSDLPMLREGVLPRSVQALRVTLSGYRGELAAGQDARRLLRFLAWPPIAPVLRAGYLQLFAGTVASLDPVQRSLLGLRLPPMSIMVMRWQGNATVAALRLATGTSPSERIARRRLHEAAGAKRTVDRREPGAAGP